jgi:hypothetical protein
MFDFLSMLGNYKERKVKNTEINNAVIDTCAITDSSKPFETGICHPNYNSGRWIIVELYDTKEEAEEGHDRWVEVFSSSLPSKLVDVSDCDIVKLSKFLETIKTEYYYEPDHDLLN